VSTQAPVLTRYPSWARGVISTFKKYSPIVTLNGLEWVVLSPQVLEKSTYLDIKNICKAVD
jgi:hypothetical protein